jgi:TonB-linked SusC/RagA family outer membrane protein
MRTLLSRAMHGPSGLIPWLCLLLLLPAGAAAQGPVGTVMGRITEGRFGEAVNGVVVEIEGTRLTAVSNAEGRYRLDNVPVGPRVLVVRQIGYATERHQLTVVTGQSATVDVALEPQAVELDAVIVTGEAGGARLRTIGHSVATINATQALEQSQAPTFSALLATRAPGVRFSDATGRVGAVPSINIRGSGGALIYIDGVRVNTSTGLGSGGATSLGNQGSNIGGRLNDIDPEDIERIEIIKGPAAATIYGTEAANGVVQIITKKGSMNRGAQFDVRTTIGSVFFRDAENRMPTNYMRDASGNVVPWNGVKQEKERGSPLFNTGQVVGFHGSVSGGTEQLRYYASASHEDTKGIEPNNTGEQLSLHTNLDVALSPKLNLATSLNFTELDNHLGNDTGLSAFLGAMFGHILLFPNTATQPNRRGFGLGYPPEIAWNLYDNSAKVTRFTTSGTATYAMTDWLRHRLLVGVDYTSGDHRSLERFATPDLAVYLTPTQALGRIAQTVRLNRNITFDYAGSANTKLTARASSYFSLGLQMLRTRSSNSFLGGERFPAPGIESITSTSVPFIPTQSDVVNTTVGAYVQQKFGWNDRLFVTGALRVDNNSAFGEDLKWVSYPKADIAWVLSEEPFWRFGNIVNTLRLRAAYGESGEAPSTFSALRTYTPIQGPGTTNAVTPGSLGNPDLKPERGKEWEVGFEAALLDRLTVEATYFSRRRVDIIQNDQVAPSSGFPGSIPKNLGRVDASGFELLTSLQAVTLRKVQWQIDANLSADRSYTLSLGQVSGNTQDAGEFVRADYPTGSIFVKRVVSADYDPVTKRAINVMCDGGPANNHAPMACATAPTVHIGQSRPRYSGAISNTVTLLQRLRLFAAIDFKSKHLRYLNDNVLRCTGSVGAGLCDINMYPENYSPLLVAQTVAPSQGLQEMYYPNAAFVKLREVSASYTVPPKWLRVANRAVVTVAARELHTWTDYPGLDPENSAQAVTPPLSRLTLTFNVGF